MQGFNFRMVRVFVRPKSGLIIGARKSEILNVLLSWRCPYIDDVRQHLNAGSLNFNHFYTYNTYFAFWILDIFFLYLFYFRYMNSLCITGISNTGNIFPWLIYFSSVIHFTIIDFIILFISIIIIMFLMRLMWRVLLIDTIQM